MYTNASRCRICGETELANVFSLGSQALTGVFPKTADQEVGAGPMDLVLCSAKHGCGLVQLLQSYSTSDMYGENYGYRSGLNASMVRHLHAKVDRILECFAPPDGSVVLDIGSNDGTTLGRYPRGKYRLIGMDPTGSKFSQYYRDDIHLVPDFFSSAALLSATGGSKAGVVTSFSMFYDLEDPVGFAKQVADCLAPDGIWVLEQSYLPTMLARNSFDTICHEHLEFYGLRQISVIAENAGLVLVDVELNDVNGGSFSVTLAKPGSHHTPNEEAIQKLLAGEDEMKVREPAVYADFARRVDAAGETLRSFLREAKAEGKRVYGLGASTKGNVLLQYYGLTPDDLVAIGEVNPDKFGSFTPGTLIPIEDEKKVLAAAPDYLVVLPWHFRDFFLQSPRLAGMKLVFPLPKLEIVELPSKV